MKISHKLHFTLAVALAACAASAALPLGYTEVEYIASSGTQYIDTGIVPKSTTRLVCDFRLPIVPTARFRCGWGSAGSQEALWFGNTADFSDFATSVSATYVQTQPGVAVDTDRHVFDLAKGSLKFDGYEYSTEATLGDTALTGKDTAGKAKTMYLFTLHQGWSPPVGPCGSMEVYSCQIYDGETLVRDFVPAVRASDNKAGLYDTVTKAFFGNLGTGDFTAGPEVRYYVGVEYIECDGNQYIDTLWTNGSNHVITFDIQPTVLPTKSGTGAGGVITYYGCRSAYNGRNISFFMDFVNNKPAFSVDFNNGNYETYRLNAANVSTNYRYVVVDSAASRSVTGYDASSNVVSTASDPDNCAATFSCAGSAYLFAINDMSSGSPAFLWNNKAKMKFYGGTIETVDGEPCCNLVPCLKSGVTPGVYDTVRDTFLPNAGSGTFTYGAETGVIYGLEPEGDVFSVSPIPDQLAATPEALAAGIAPSVTVSNLATSVELVQGTDYTVAYSNNIATGTAYAIVTGAGDYAEKTAVVTFVIDCPFDASNYDHTMTISPATGAITAPLTNFPILVRLSTSRQPWFNPSDCAANGADLRFALSDGTLLAHEIDTWNAAGESTVWVNIPELTASTVVNAYWGAKSAAFLPIMNPADAWPDFIAVYHLGEGDATARDSSANGYDAVNGGAVSLGSNPRVGGCASITGSYVSDVTSFTRSYAAKPLSDITRVTVSGWVAVDKMTGTKDSSIMILVQKYTGWNDSKGGWLCRYLEGYPFFGLVVNSAPSASFINWNSDAPATGGGWMYLTCAVDGTTATKYINGATFEDHYNKGGALFGGNPATLPHGIVADAGTFKFGASNVEGRMDELRLRDGVASAAWVAADYAQQNVDDFLFYAEPIDEAFTVSPIPDQTVSSFAELFAGVTLSVTVSNLTAGTELAPGTDYTVTYMGNTSLGLAYAVVVGRGEYAAYTNRAPFLIGGIDAYYIVGGSTSDAADNSTVSGDGSNPTGWATTKGSGTRAIKGITEDNTVYYVWQYRWVRTPPRKNYATPPTSAIVVEPSCTWELGDKLTGQTLTLSNLFVRTGGKLVVAAVGDGAVTVNNTYAGNWTMDEGSTVSIAASKEADGAVKSFTLSATVTGRGAIVMPSTAKANAYDGTLANKITGDISGFTGDIGTWNGYNAVSLELVNAASIPGDPVPEEIAYVIVTNSATLKIDQDWTSPTNRIWILGDAGTPTINVPSGKTVTIDGDLVGSVGFKKTGTGTLVIRGASPAFSGEITINQGVVRFAGQGARVAASAGVTLTEDGGTYEIAALSVSPIPVQTVYDLDTLAAGIRPTLVVSNLDAQTELVLGTDYSVAYANITTPGIATATVTGLGEFAGLVRSVDFIIHSVKEIGASYNLSADEDWTGFESVTVASGVVIDLKGHNLTISGLNGAGEITDSVGGGELHYAVPAVFESGYAAKIESVSLTGLLKLVKDGPGQLTAIKQRQTYTGGTVVDAGILKYGCTGNNSIDSTYPFGYSSASEKGTISVSAGAILDPAGSHNWENHTITLNGGMISNTVAQTSGLFNPKLVLTADSTFASEKSYSLAVTSGNLNGYTLRVWFAHNGETLNFCPDGLSNGTVYVVDGSWFKSASKNATAPTVDLSVYCALKMDSYSWTIRNYTARYNQNYAEGTAALNVLGTFTPVENYFYGPTMQDGSAIDLSAKTGAWNVKSSLAWKNYNNGTTKFAEGASVAILLGERTPAVDEKIVTWTAATKPADSVSLTNATYVLRAEDDGLYVDSLRTFAANDLPDIGEAKLASDLAAAIESSLVMTDIVTGETLALGTDYTYSFSVSGSRCTVTVTGLGDHAGATVVRTFDIGRISLRQSAFSYSMDIFPTAGKLTAPLTNFPVLVRLSTDIKRFSYERCKADELRFALPDGTLLAHEIDWWNESGESTVWVNVPELTSNTVFTAYWGMPAGREALRAAGETWPEYVGVWHFSEASGIAHDSSGNRYDSIDNGGGTLSNLNAKVGLARNANMTSMITSVTKLDSTSAAKPMTTMSKFSVSGWMYSNVDVATSSKKYPQQIRNKNGWNESTGWYTGIEGASDKFCGNGSGATREIITLPVSIYTNWVYLTTIFDDASCSVYANGVFVKTSAINAVKASTTYPLRFATDFNGIMDEYRIHDRLQDAAYIEADYATQTDPDFLTFGKVKNPAPTMLILR